MISVDVNAQNAKKKTRSIRTNIKSMFGEIGFNSGKMAAFYCAYYTLPVGLWNFGKMEKRIESNVKTTYASKSDSDWQSKAYNLIKQEKGEDRAKKWWQQYKSDTWNAAMDYDGSGAMESEGKDYESTFDRMRKIPRKVNEDKYLAYRKANNGKIPQPDNPARRVLGMVPQDARQKLIQKRKKTMGLAKAGWKAGFHDLGGSGTKVSKLGQGKAWPKEINVPYKKFGGRSLGSGTLSVTKTGFVAVLTNKVRYAGDAFNGEWGRSYAAKATTEYMRIVYDLRRKHMKAAVAKRQSNRAAA